MFWQVYLQHTRFLGLKWTLLLAFLQLMASFVASSYITRIFTDDSRDTLLWAFVASVAKPFVQGAFDTILNQKANKEAATIATAISQSMEKAMIFTTNANAAEIPSSTIVNGCNDAFYAYYYTTSNIVKLFPELVDFVVVIYVASNKSWLLTQVFVFGTAIILLIQKMMDKKMEILTKQMVERQNQTRLYISRLWTDFFFWVKNQHYLKPKDPATCL